MVTALELQNVLNEWNIFDRAITRHGFTPYNRDYRIEIAPEGAGEGVEYMFRGCVEAHYENRVVPTAYPAFMDDRFIDHHTWEAAGHPQGFVWSVNFAEAYPGWKYVENSERATSWSHKLGLPMHEVRIETNIYLLTLVFHDLTVRPLA